MNAMEFMSNGPHLKKCDSDKVKQLLQILDGMSIEEAESFLRRASFDLSDAARAVTKSSILCIQHDDNGSDS